jgi:hypothetical protein
VSPAVLSGNKSVVVYTKYSYKWRDKHDEGCEKFR